MKILFRNKLWLFSLLIVLLSNGCGTTQQVKHNDTAHKTYETYAIGFYNVENLWHPSVDPNNPRDTDYIPDGPYNWTMPKYERKLDNLAQVVSKLGRDHTPYGAAFIGIAEIENRQVLEDLVKRPAIADLGLKVIHEEGPDRRGIDVAAIYNPSIFKLISYKCYAYPKLKENPTFVTRDQLLVTGMLAGEKVHFIVMHWPSRYGGKTSDYLRVNAAKLTNRIMDEIYAEDPSAKIIIMGDLNDDPTNVSSLEILKGKETREEVEPRGLYNPALSIYKDGIGTLVYQNKWNFFDQMMVNYNYLHGNGLNYWKMEIFNRDFLITQEGKKKGWPFRSFDGNSFTEGYSDHFPVVIYLVKEK